MPRRIIGVEKNYDWGDSTSIATVLGNATTATPIAEYWWGTHHQGASHLDSVDGPLLSSISGEMNVMVKLLACNKPLSLPGKVNCKLGFSLMEKSTSARNTASPLNSTSTFCT